MEKFSNNRKEYWNQVKKELKGSIQSDDFRFQYVEIGQLLTHGFSVTLTKKNPQELDLKIWDAEYDNTRYDKGIFNLNRIAITEKKVELNSRELDTIKRLLNSSLELNNSDGIVLDGLFCQFEIKDIKLNWNANEEINKNLNELVKFLRNKSALNFT